MSTKSQYSGGLLNFFDGTTFETILPMAALFFEDDFVGAGYGAAIPAAGSQSAGMPWVKKIVGAGPPTVAQVANAVGGQLACTLLATSEKEDAVLYWNDSKSVDITKGARFEARVNLSVLPSAAGVQAVWGLASNWIDGPDNNTCFVEFGATANGAILMRSFDGTTLISAATGLTVAAGDVHTYHISCRDITNVTFEIDGNIQNTPGQFNLVAATGTLAVLQPYLACYKPSGTGVATLVADFVRTWANRS